MHQPILGRREILGAASGLAILPLDGRASPQSADPAPNLQTVSFTLNGARIERAFDPRTTLLDALRDQLDLPGTKKGCGMGACGACTVHLDGKRVVSCLVLAARLDGRAVTTIEGLAEAGALHPVQLAFVAHDALQCGYCTPGQVMSAAALVEEGHTGSDDQIREWMSGNICRCGAYPNIVAAVRDVSNQRAERGGEPERG